MMHRPIVILIWLLPAACFGQGPPAYPVNPKPRDPGAPAAERAWLSSNFEWLGNPPLEFVMSERYYYSDETDAYALLRLNSNNLVSNGCFSRDAWRRGVPDNWMATDWRSVRRYVSDSKSKRLIAVQLGPTPTALFQAISNVEPDKTYVFSWAAKIKGKANVEVVFDGARRVTKTLDSTDWNSYQVSVRPKSSDKMEVRFVTQDEGAVAYFTHVRLVDELEDRMPFWPFSAAEVANLRARLSVFRTWGGQETAIGSRMLEGLAVDETQTIALPLDKLKSTNLGLSYKAVVEILAADGGPVRDAQGSALRKDFAFGKIHPPRQVLSPIRKLEFRDRMACFVNERPFFPLMLYNWYDGELDWDAEMPVLRKMGFNTVYLADRSLAKVKANNLYFLMNRPSSYVDNPQPKQGDRRVLEAARRDYGEWLLGYADGVEWDDGSIPALVEQYKKDKEVDPSRLVIQCVQGVDPGRYARYAQLADILWTEPHTHDEPFVATAVQSARDFARENNGQRGAWVELATYSPWGPPGVNEWKLRMRAYAALVRGAQGMDWFAHHAYEADSQGRPGGRTADMLPLTWSELRGLLAEIVYLTPALCAPDHAGLEIKPDLVDAVRRDVDGVTYVIACPSFLYFKGGLSKPEKSGPAETWQRWNWQPGPEGRMAHRSQLAGIPHHSHWYWFGKQYRLQPGDRLLQEVYIEPGGEPDNLEINFASLTVSGDYYEIRGMTRWIPWNPFQYWGDKRIHEQDLAKSTNPVHVYRGPLPPSGKWTTLEVDPVQLDMVGPGPIYAFHGTRWMVNSKAGHADVWWGRTFLKRASGEMLEVFGPTPGNSVSFCLKDLPDDCIVTSLLDGRTLKFEDKTFQDQLFENTDTGLWHWNQRPQVYRITGPQ